MWRRTADEARSAVRRVRDLRVLPPAGLEALAASLGRVEALCSAGQATAPSASLEAPTGPARGTYDRARTVVRSLREVEYRAGLVARGDATQRALLDRALTDLAAAADR